MQQDMLQAGDYISNAGRALGQANTASADCSLFCTIVQLPPTKEHAVFFLVQVSPCTWDNRILPFEIHPTVLKPLACTLKNPHSLIAANAAGLSGSLSVAKASCSSEISTGDWLWRTETEELVCTESTATIVLACVSQVVLTFTFPIPFPNLETCFPTVTYHCSSLPAQLHLTD